MKAIKTQILIDASPESVWQTLTDFESFGEWNPFITSIEASAEEGSELSIVIEPKPGSKTSFKPEVLVSMPAEELRWKGKLFVKGLFDGEHYFILERQNDGSTLFKHGEYFSGLLVRPLMSMIGEDTEQGFKAMNSALKRFCESKVKEGNHAH